MRKSPWAAAVVSVLVLAGCADDAPDAGRATPPTVATAAPATVPEPATTTTVAAAPADDGLELISTGTNVVLSVPPPELAPLARRQNYFPTYDEFGGSPLLLAARHATFDVVATRASYDEPIAVTARIGSNRVVVPDGAIDDWAGLEDFFEIVVVDADGQIVYDESVRFCPEVGSRSRVSPDGPVESAPVGDCGLTPLGVGARWTLDAGWATTVLPDLSELEMESGNYDLTVSVTEQYRPLFTGPTEAQVGVSVEAEDITNFLSDIDSDGDGLDDAVDPDLDGDGIDDLDDDAVFTAPELAGTDSDADGVPDDFDEFVDADLDGLDDRDAFLFSDSGSAEDDGQFLDDAIADEEPDDEPAHAGRSGPAAHPPIRSLPDLRSLPAFGFAAFNDEDSGLDLLGFSAITWNSGAAPMVVDGFARPDEPDVMDAYQQFGDSPGLTARSAQIGTLEYHAGGGHDHWHFTDFARYDLLTEGGEPMQRSGKESWCLVDTDPVDLRSEASHEVVAGTLESSCGDRGALWVRETLGVGWGDQYDQDRSGQAFDITDVPNGRYLVRISANPTGSIYEVSTTNNVADRLVILGGTPGNRTVAAPPLGLVDTEVIDESTAKGF